MKLKLYDLINPASAAGVYDEVHRIVIAICPGQDLSPLAYLFRDIQRLFAGLYPGYRASNTKYHDLEHTCAVFLAAARLLHGMWSEGEPVGRREILLTLSACLFHDTGLIQDAGDSEGTGAKHTIGHEQRSIDFMRTYFEAKGWKADDADDCAAMIECTIMSRSPGKVHFRDEQTAVCGRVVGSADLLAQMADRAYLEKLLLLYEEFVEAGIRDYSSPIDLLEKTEDFYRNVILVRLQNELGGVSRFMIPHFRRRWNLEEDLYAESIENNISYLNEVLRRPNRPFRDILRRAGILGRACDPGCPYATFR